MNNMKRFAELGYEIAGRTPEFTAPMFEDHCIDDVTGGPVSSEDLEARHNAKIGGSK